MKESNTIEKPQMGWVCSYTPLELIYAAGFLPYRIVGHSNPIENADSYIHPNYCQFVKSSIDVAVEGGYDFLEGVIFVNSCDAMRRLHDIWKRYIPSKFIYLLDIPMGSSSLGLKYIKDEFKKLKTALEKYTARIITDEILEDSIDTFMESRVLFHKVNSSRSKNPPLIKGSKIIEITHDFFKSDPKTWNKRIQEIINTNMENLFNSKNNNQSRIVLAGSPIHDINFVSFIESCGLDVVYEELCTGSKFFDMNIDKNKIPLDSLSEAYLNRTPCARMMRIEERAEKLIDISKKFNVNGIIHHSLKFCDTYLYDVPRLRDLLIEKELSVLFIESDGTLGSLNQLKTRIEAFSEMIKKK
ncbi:MAG: 2-hydroxyacyl-CoA dehydratase subunit D [Candidatus Odinarchaeota archaeon]